MNNKIITHPALCLLLFISCACSPQHGPNATYVEWNKHLGPGHQVVVVNGVRMEPYQERIPGTDIVIDMIPVPGGEFLMGSPSNEQHREDSEGPQVRVKVDPFWISKYEITWEQFEQFEKLYQHAREYKTSIESAKMLPDAVSIPTPKYEQVLKPLFESMGITPKHPAMMMTQLSAKQYTKWVTKFSGHFYRLPTEAEWEYAARAGTTTAFSWGSDPSKADQYTWYFDNSHLKSGFGAPQAVGTKKPNPWGLYDMHGNVSEWVIGEPASHYKNFATDKTHHWKHVLNPEKSPFNRIVRGGSWDSDPEDLRSAARYFVDKELFAQIVFKDNFLWWTSEGTIIGFRIIRPLYTASAEEKLDSWQIRNEYLDFLHQSRPDLNVQIIIEKPQ